MSSLGAKVIGLGYNTLDHVCVVDHFTPLGGKARVRSYRTQPGGQVPTALVALQRWGVATVYVGPFGSDEGAAAQRASLESEGVDLSQSWTCDGCGTDQSFITVDSVTGERSIQWYRDERMNLSPERVAKLDLSGVRALLSEADDGAAAVELARRARASGVRVVLDADNRCDGFDDLLGSTDIAIVPSDFTGSDLGSAGLDVLLRELVAGGPSVAVVTLGPQGALALSGGELLRQDAYPVRAVDTTSAGDVFHAAFLFGDLVGLKVVDSLRFAAAAGALACERAGGRDSIPSLQDVRELSRCVW